MLLNHLESKIFHYSEKIDKKLDSLKILVCISGGIDSMVLLNAANTLKIKFSFKLEAAHVNYNQHEKSYSMLEFCENICKSNGINLLSMSYNNSIKSNFECKARNIRYEFFNNIDLNNNYDFILTGHHQMDQLETIIMNQVKNSNWISKIGIREFYGKLRRPLLDISKESIYKYQKQNNITYLDDPMNTNYSFLRNSIRLVLKKINSKKVTQYYLKKREHYLKRFKKSIKLIDESQVSIKNNYVEINKYYFLSLENEIKKILINKIISSQFNVSINKSRFFWCHLFNVISSKHPGKKLFLTKDIYVNNDRHCFNIALIKKNPLKRVLLNEDKEWNNYKFKIKNNILNLNHFSRKVNYLVLDCKLFNEGIYIRNRRVGDKIKINKSTTKKIKKLFIDYKVSNVEKDSIPIVTDKNNKVIWVPGYAKSNEIINEFFSKNIAIKYSL